MSKEKYKIMLVEDSDDDVILFELALKRTGLLGEFEIIHRLSDGAQAIQFFSQPPSVLESEPHPEIVILDIKMPGRTGLEVLDWMRNLKARPIVAIYTSSVLDQDKEKARQLGAEVFQTKNFESGEFSRFLLWLGRLAEERRRLKLDSAS